MTTNEWLSAFNIIWNLCQIGILLALVRIGTTVQGQMDEVLQLMHEIRAEINGDRNPILQRGSWGEGTKQEPRWDTTAAGDGHLERKPKG